MAEEIQSDEEQQAVGVLGGGGGSKTKLPQERCESCETEPTSEPRSVQAFESQRSSSLKLGGPQVASCEQTMHLWHSRKVTPCRMRAESLRLG